MEKRSTKWIIILLALIEFSAAFPFQSLRLKRQGPEPMPSSCTTCGTPQYTPQYVPSSCSTCGNFGYGSGLGSYFYGQYGGGQNNNYGGTNIGRINVKNINV